MADILVRDYKKRVILADCDGQMNLTRFYLPEFDPYSNLPGNLWGQICPQFAAVWWALCLAFIPAYDWLRWAVTGGQRPHYHMGW